MSKSLGQELLGKMKGWGPGMESESEDDGEEEEEPESAATTPGVEDDDTEGEDVIQTIITRKKRKVASRANITSVEHRAFEETKEYSDSSTQYEPHLFFVSTRTQTDAPPKFLTASAGLQTDPEPVVAPSPARHTAEEIQTPEKVASSSAVAGPSTLPTPCAERATCNVLEKILANSPSTGLPRAPSDADSSPHHRRGGRFYNIYNMYVYGPPTAAPHSNTNPFPAIPPPSWWVDGTVLLFLALGPSVMIPYYSVPGGPSHYDRAVWSSFNTMQYTGEGFASEGTEALWSFLGRVGGGAARMVRGWPT
ncbi:hypothetical protein C8R47DRAFT_1226579 [Mycena vitilis]|nr:hypothetical protein C8R47DRAFT_1226579 [Mycena vitilis]